MKMETEHYRRFQNESVQVKARLFLLTADMGSRHMISAVMFGRFLALLLSAISDRLIA